MQTRGGIHWPASFLLSPCETVRAGAYVPPALFLVRTVPTCNSEEHQARITLTLGRFEQDRLVKALVAIVEDNEAVRDALATILVLEGYSVRTYASGEAFMRAARNKRQPDCVLLDLFMPDGSGADVLE